MLRPELALSVGTLRSTSDAPAAAPLRIVVERDLEIAVDAATLSYAEDAGATAGAPVSVALGLDGPAETVFTGSVVSVGASVSTTGGRRSVVVAFGRLRSLVDLRVAAVYENRTLGAVARDLVLRAGLVPGDVDEGPLLPLVAVDVRRSAYDHLRGLAHRFGREVWGDRTGRVSMGQPGGVGGPAAGLVEAAAAALATSGSGLRHGADVLTAATRRRPSSFDVADVAGFSPASTHGQTATAWLTTDDQAARASAGEGSRTRLVLEPIARTRDLAQEAANGRVATARRRAGDLNVTVTGRPGLDLGDEVTLSGPSNELLSVTGHVRALRHVLDARSGFTTTVRLATAVRS